MVVAPRVRGDLLDPYPKCLRYRLHRHVATHCPRSTRHARRSASDKHGRHEFDRPLPPRRAHNSPLPPLSGSGVRLLLRHQALPPGLLLLELLHPAHGIPVRRPVLAPRELGDHLLWSMPLPFRTIHRRCLSAPGPRKSLLSGWACSAHPCQTHLGPPGRDGCLLAERIWSVHPCQPRAGVDTIRSGVAANSTVSSAWMVK